MEIKSQLQDALSDLSTLTLASIAIVFLGILALLIQRALQPSTEAYDPSELEALGETFELEVIPERNGEPPALVGEREGLPLTVLPRSEVTTYEHRRHVRSILVARLVVAPLLSREVSLRARGRIRPGGDNSAEDLNPLFHGLQGQDREVLGADNHHSGLLRGAILHAFMKYPRSYLRSGILHLEPGRSWEHTDPHDLLERIETIARELTQAAVHARERNGTARSGPEEPRRDTRAHS
jgi:hypothetical protein